MSVVVVIALAILMLGTVWLAMQTSLDSASANSGATGSSSGPLSSPSATPSSLGEATRNNPFTGADPVTVTREVCRTVVPGFGTACGFSTYDAGTPLSFNMTSVQEQAQPNQAAVTVFTDYFVIAVDQGDTIGFSMKSTNTTTFLGYFAPGAEASSSAISPPELAGTGEMLFNQTGNYETYSGNETAQQPGAYVFVFSVPAPELNDSVRLLLMDSAAYNTGITVKLGTPDVQQVTITDILPSGNGGAEGFGWDEIPITVYAPTTTAVNLTSLTLNEGGWLRIVPSYLPDVGPQGANATLYMAGVEPVATQLYSSLFIGASGADGLTGDAVIPVEGSMDLDVTNGTGPIGLSGGGIPYVSGLVYDPASGTASGPSLPITVSVVGILEQNGSVVPLPSWLNVGYPEQHAVFGNGSTVVTTTTLGPGVTFSSVPQYETDDVNYSSSSSTFSIALKPYNPYFFVLVVDGSSAPKADQGLYTVVLDETVGGQHFVSYLEVDAVPLTVVGTLINPSQ